MTGKATVNGEGLREQCRRCAWYEGTSIRLMYILRERGKGDVGPMAVGCSIALAVTPVTKEIEAPVRINKHFGEGSFNVY